METIANALDEQTVAKNVEDLRRATAECNDSDTTAFAKETIADTVKEYTIDKASAPGADEGVLVQITRPGATTDWRVDLHAAGRGKFLGTYGLAVGPNLDKTYHSAAESNGKFLITRDFHRDNGQLTPAVLFSWLPRARVLSDWVFSPTVGLGFDLSQLAGFLGYSATYNRNIGLSAGIAVQRVQRLKGKYHEGQEVGENLDPADLASRPYHPNAFVAITIRSVTAPFK